MLFEKYSVDFYNQSLLGKDDKKSTSMLIFYLGVFSTKKLH